MSREGQSDALGVLDRMTAILEAFDEDDRGLRISELAARAELPKSTVSRLVSALVRQHYLERDGAVIHLGLRLFELGQLAEEPRELRASALPIMADLRGSTGRTAYLAIRDGQDMVCIAIMRGDAATPLICRIGGRIPAHATALGKAVLAFAEASALDRLLDGGLHAWTSRTTTDPGALRRQLADVRHDGVAVEVGEFDGEVASVAAPVSDSSRTVVAAIGVSARAHDVELETCGAAVRGAALALTHRLATVKASTRRRRPQ